MVIAYCSVVIGAQLSQPAGQGGIESRWCTACLDQVGEDVAYLNRILNDRRSLQFGQELQRIEEVDGSRLTRRVGLK